MNIYRLQIDRWRYVRLASMVYALWKRQSWRCFLQSSPGATSVQLVLPYAKRWNLCFSRSEVLNSLWYWKWVNDSENVFPHWINECVQFGPRSSCRVRSGLRESQSRNPGLGVSPWVFTARQTAEPGTTPTKGFLLVYVLFLKDGQTGSF